MSIVIDSSALVAMIKGESGAQNVLKALPGAHVSAVILAESLSKLADLGFDPNQAEQKLRRAGVLIESFDERDIPFVLGIRAVAKRGASMADRICLALAMRLNLPCLTGDRPWKALGLPIELRNFR